MTGSDKPSRYWNELKSKLTKQEDYDELFGNIEKLKMPGQDGSKSCQFFGSNKYISTKINIISFS